MCVFCLCLLHFRTVRFQFCLSVQPAVAFRSAHCFQHVVYMCLSFGAVSEQLLILCVAVMKGQPTRTE